MTKQESKSDPLRVVWFKRDLRIWDHRPLVAAARSGPILPLVLIEPELWRQPDMSGRQFAFYRECIEDLAQQIASLNQPLIIRVGDAPETFARIHADYGIAGLWSHEETGNGWTFERDLKVAQWCREHSIPWSEFRQDGVVRKLKSRHGWAARWDKRMAEAILKPPSELPQSPHTVGSETLPTPKELGLGHDQPEFRQRGGRAEALSLLGSFLTERGETYRSAMSSPVEGQRACSRLSPYLAWGCLSLAEVTQSTWRRQRDLKATGGPSVAQWRGSLASFSGRLHWHCHFMQKLEDEPRLEFENLHSAYDGLRTPTQSDDARLSAWQSGETGLPFVDACMRYLIASGWLNFRMRAMLMATASYHLWLDWRKPGLHLARQFTDYEAGIHWPQVQMQSGTTGINTVRIYNPVKQGYDQDPTGAFIRRWVPELESLPDDAIHTPWRSSDAAHILDKTYPLPIVDHIEAAREARQKIYGIRKGEAFRKTADAIQIKHGSRKGGNAARKKARSRKPESRQLAMDFEPVSSSDRGADQ